MKLFSKRRPPGLSPRQEQLATQIAGRITRAQHRAADWLNAKTARLSGKTWLWLLAGFCTVFGGYCLSLLIGAFN
ncbi:MAG TPA: hypothetical protein VHA56_22200 [Mucilaginibacter sp.]|nr:hypothetical protein [Mucilaginibacter sp.]